MDEICDLIESVSEDFPTHSCHCLPFSIVVESEIETTFSIYQSKGITETIIQSYLKQTAIVHCSRLSLTEILKPRPLHTKAEHSILGSDKDRCTARQQLHMHMSYEIQSAAILPNMTCQKFQQKHLGIYIFKARN